MTNEDVEQRDCLALNIYHESRGESTEGQFAVAHVTMNRVKHSNWGNTICDVVYDPMQFSWTHLLTDTTPYELDSWLKAKMIANKVMNNQSFDLTHGAVFYHATRVDPSWVPFVDESVTIGDHIFYTWDGDWDMTN